MLLNFDVLHPSISKIKNPMAQALELVEQYLLEKSHTLFRKELWPKLQHHLVMKVLRGPSKGQAIQGIIARSPDDQLKESLLSLLSSIRASKYYISDLWWAFLHWLSTGNLSARYPQVELPEIQMLTDRLQEHELSSMKVLASQQRKISEQEIASQIKRLQPKIRWLCSQRARILTRTDPAGYGLEDLIQETNCFILSLLHSKDHMFGKDITGWLLVCADNYLQNVLQHATAGKRSRLILGADRETLGFREVQYNEDKGRDPGKTEDVNLIDYQLMLRKVQDPRIKKYLQVLLGNDQQHPEFWAWFQNSNPQLAMRDTNDPRVIGPWIQRWLGLGKNDLLHFLHAHLPDILVERQHIRRTDPLKKGA